MIFQQSSLSYDIPLVKDQSSVYEICSLAICINIKAFNRVNRKQLNIVKTFFEISGILYWCLMKMIQP